MRVQNTVNSLENGPRIAIKTKARDIHYKLLDAELVVDNPLANYYVREALIGIALDEYNQTGDLDSILSDFNV